MAVASLLLSLPSAFTSARLKAASTAGSGIAAFGDGVAAGEGGDCAHAAPATPSARLVAVTSMI